MQSSDVVVDSSRAYTQAYVCLRHIIQEYIISGIAPLLSESPKPIGGYESVQMQGRAVWDLVQDNAEFVRLQDNQDYIQNVEGMLVTEQENPHLFEDLEHTDIS